MPEVAVEQLPSLPAMGILFAKALVPARRRAAPSVPTRTVMVTGVSQDASRLADYDRVCGFTLRDRVPATWLHVLSFPLQVHLLAGPDSTIRLAGIVHVANMMTQHRPVMVGERLTLSVRAANLRPHRRGALVDLIGQARVSDELVWDGISTYLAAGVTVAGVPEERPREPGDTMRPNARWRLPADLGRDYRRVSQDPNPIHTHRLAARAFGFSRPIIHGMWTHARALAALEGRLPEAYTAAVRFTKPIMLPSTVTFGSAPDGAGWHLAVMTREGTKPHMTGLVIPERPVG